MRRVVLTGIGAVTPVGRDAETSWQSLKAGRSGIKRIDYYDASTFPVQIAGICDDFDLSQLPDENAAPHLHRGERFGVAAAAEALRNAELESGTYPPERVGVAIGGSVDRPELQEFSDAFAVAPPFAAMDAWLVRIVPFGSTPATRTCPPATGCVRSWR